MVIRDRSTCSVDPTVILSILKLLALNKLVTLNKTPGLFSTRAATICHDSLLTCARLSSVSNSILLSLRLCSCYHVLQARSRCHEGVDILLRIDSNINYGRYLCIQCLLECFF